MTMNFLKGTKIHKLILVVILFLISVPSTSFAYNSHTFEDTQYLDDQPYIAQVGSPAYVCVILGDYRGSTHTSRAANGNQVTQTITYDSQIPQVAESISGSWYTATSSGDINLHGNPCTNGGTSIWYSNVIFDLPKNSAKTVMKMKIGVFAPEAKIDTLTAKNQFIFGTKKTHTYTTQYGSLLFSGTVTVYRSQTDAEKALVGYDYSSPGYSARDLAFQKWFPCIGLNGGC